jgi:uncharacterized membrane protein YebE (DUF533 family)
MANPDLVGDYIDERCPKCSATLLGNKRGDKWCSNAGGITLSGCQYGLGTLANIVFNNDDEQQHPPGQK